jgi:pimeloyl-ACP methyl ester carboxylesterase
MSNAQGSYAHLADGRPIYYCEEGAGPPLLFAHGSGCDADDARPLFQVLRDRFRCIALDRAGYHRSGWLDRLTTLEEQVEALAVVHSACTLDPLWLLSHSAGGNFAVAYAVAHPDRVRGLLLFEPPLLAVFPAGSRPSGAAAMIEIVAPLFRAGRIHEGIAQFWGTFDPELSPEALDERATADLSSDRRRYSEALAMEHPLVVSWCPTPSEWTRLTQPALVMAGDRTQEFHRATAIKVAELLPRGELAMLEGHHHGAIWTAPDVVAQRIVEFIDREERSVQYQEK